MVEVTISGRISKFAARAAWLYLPPAYLTSEPPLLPVLELIGGQPGTSHDWLKWNDLAGVMDRFAAAHHGLAPVVVMPDALGSFLSNPLCINSKLGQSDTYLSVDVPNWVRTHLRVDHNPTAWAIGGGSFGGTCAWQLAVDHPKLFPTFLDFSGVYEQLRGTLQETIDATFDGNSREFANVNPAQILVHHRRPSTWAMLGTGSDDTYYLGEIERTATLCRHAGMHVQTLTVPGGHTGSVFAALLTDSLDWLAVRDGIL
ncbi:MAG TPA: alpha/beta hydrolase-fold protein [Acidimicrobiales bacterium]|nr:alpha/beta hydrolase-fold protein [Acidimicrobiales bacterium]